MILYLEIMSAWMMNGLYGCRGKRSLPSWTRWAPILMVSRVAQYRRDAGLYDARTLALYRRSWTRKRSLKALLNYALFCRDLGMAPAQKYMTYLSDNLGRLNRWEKRAALDLLIETGFLFSTALNENGIDDLLNTIRAQQDTWRTEFAQLIRSQGVNGVCVVGNSGKLLGSGLGSKIDGHGVVVRFNHFCGPASSQTDLGKRVDVWVTSPSFERTAPLGVKWIVVTGPDMAFKLRDWRRFENSLKEGAKILTIPLQIWHELVSQLQAPPSAGLLFLAWSRSMLGSWERLWTAGFGSNIDVNAQYHHANASFKAVTRHNWCAERIILNRWRQEGLHNEHSI